MKRSVWKKIAASICSAVFVVAALLGVMVALPTSAQTEATWQTGVFEMQDGASLKLSEKNGLRFIVKLDETVRDFVVENDDAQMGFVIAPKQLIDEANGDYLHMPKKVDVSVDKDKIYQEGEFYFANGCIVNVKYNSYTYDFMAVAYIKQGETVRYTEYNNYARNNLYDTVNMAVLSGYAETVLSFETYNGWYGSDVFPIVVEKTEEYNEVVSLVNEDKLDLSQKFVTVTEDVSTSREFNDEALQPNVLSQGLDVLNKQIAGLPDVENFAMPDGIGMISRIRAAEKAYNALSADDRAQVEDYAKLQGLLSAIEGYDRVYMNGENDGTVVASKVPNYTSASGGSATTRQDEVYGNVLTVQSNADGKAQLHIQNFPSVQKYEKVYFYVKTSVSCNIYLADGITNDGWGDNWHNTWGVEIGCNAGKWRLIEVSVADGYIGTNFAIGLRADTTGFTFEISDFYGIDKSKTQAVATLPFGQRTDNGTVNEYGKVYTLATQWGGDTDFQSFEANVMSNALAEGFNSFYFYIYNPNKNDVTMELVNTTSWKHYDATTLKAGEWTKFTISAEAIEANKSGGTVCCVSSGASTAGWQMSPIYLHNSLPMAALSFGQRTDSGTENEYGKIYNLATQWGGDTDFQSFEANVLNSALTAGHDSFYFYIYNPNANDVTMELVNTTSWKHYDATTLKAGEWTKFTISAEAIEANKSGGTVCCVSSGASTAGWQMSPIYLGPEPEKQESVYLDYADVKAVMEQINALPQTPTESERSQVEAARAAFEALATVQQAQVTNLSKLSAAENYLTDIAAANEVISLIDKINARDIDEALVTAARTAYNALSVTQQAYVTNASALEEYEEQIRVEKEGALAAANVNTLIANLPDSVTMPDHLVFVSRIEAARDAYAALNDETKNMVENYAKLRSLLSMIKGYETVQVMSVDSVNVIPSTVPNYTSTVGGTASMGYDGYYGDYLKVQSNADGKAAIQFKNFPDVSAYETLYFNIRVVGTSCDIYLADGATNNGWGNDWKNTWSMDGFWTNNGNWIQKEVAVSTGIFSADWVLGLRTDTTGFSFEITNIVGYTLEASSGDAIDKVQTRIDALDTANPDETKVELARAAYEALNEKEKALVNAEKLIACEETLYANAVLNEFIVGGETKYKLYYEEDKEAVAFVQEQIKELTDVRFALDGNEPTALTKYSYAIVFGYSSLWEELGVALPTLENDSGYAIRKVGRAVLVYATSQDGYRLAALAFLREAIGYDMISEDCVIYNRDPATLPELNLVEAPDFEFRQQQTYMTKDELYGMGMHAHTDIWIAIEGWDMHNSLLYLPTATYRGAHPSWYYDYTDSNGTERTQICPTAGGSSAEFDLMTTEIANGMLEHINANPTLENISFSIMDTADKDDCTCTRCKLYDSLYGEGGFAAAWIDLMNAVNAKVRAKLASGREIQIAFLAYRGTEKAPVNDDFSLMKRYEIADNGAYTQTNEVLKCDEGVTVWLAPINALYAENLNHPDNAEHLATVKKWCALSSSVYVWAYGTNFKNYMYPYNSWQASAENYKILKELGVKAVWSQSNETEATAFSDLKGYIDSKFMFDVNADYNAVLNSYFTGYFGVASAKMRSMFDQIVARCETIEADYDGCGRGIYDEIENVSGFIGFGTKTYWEKSWLEGLVTLCDEAKALVDADGSLTETQKTAIKNRITKESLFPRYVLCTTFASKYSSDKKKEMRQAFKADCNALGFTLYKEANGELSNLYSAWGI